MHSCVDTKNTCAEVPRESGISPASENFRVRPLCTTARQLYILARSMVGFLHAVELEKVDWRITPKKQLLHLHPNRQ